MDTEKARVGEGNVAVTIDGQDMVLRPSFIAAQLISRQSGGIMGAIERVLKLDLDTINQVVTVGLGYGSTRRPPKDLDERIWRSGMTDDNGQLVERCVTFLRVLANGGRMPKEPPEEASEHGEQQLRDPPSS